MPVSGSLECLRCSFASSPSVNLQAVDENCFLMQLLPETLYLTANIIDRFLEKKLIIRKKLQLVH